MGVELNEDQAMAVYKSDTWWRHSNDQVLEISGPAGSGKTFLARYMIERFGLELNEVLFVAFMGKAAMMLCRNGLPAKTIHSTIYDYVKVLDKIDDKIQFTPAGRPKTKMTHQLKKKLNKKIRLIVVDEGGMVNTDMARDLKSFGVPILVLGDLNQLPPVFGKSGFLQNPDIILNQIMRQAEGSPIIHLSQKVINDEELKYGVYGNCSVIPKSSIDEFIFKNSDIILTGSNRLRHEVNCLFREHLLDDIKLDYPNVGEKIICKKNNWNKSLNNDIYLTNGMTGVVSHVELSSFNGKQMKIDFRPDFADKSFKHLNLDYNHLYASPSDDIITDPYSFTRDKFEFAYAITTHSSQGSQYPKVLFMPERMGLSKDDFKKFMYTGITRAQEQIVIAL